MNPRTPMGQRPERNYSKEFHQDEDQVSFTEEDLKEFLDRLKASNRSRMRTKTLYYILKNFGNAVNWNCNLSDVTQYLADRRKEVSNRTLSDEIQAIKQFFKDLGVYWINRIKTPKVRKHKPKIIRRKDIRKFITKLSNAKVDEEYIFRAKAAVTLSAVSGMRPWEVYRLEWNDIDVRNRVIYLPAEKTKTKEERIVIFNKETQGLLVRLKELFPSQPFSTKTIYLLTDKMDPKPELKLKHCRKYFSQTWDRRGLPTSIKEMLLGHFGNVDLRNYNGQSAEDLKEIYDKANIKVLE